MTRREEWKAILDTEVKRWSSMSCEEVLSELHSRNVYEQTDGSNRYQVKAELLVSATDYIQVGIRVNDCSIPASFHPASQIFICPRTRPPATAD